MYSYSIRTQTFHAERVPKPNTKPTLVGPRVVLAVLVMQSERDDGTNSVTKEMKDELLYMMSEQIGWLVKNQSLADTRMR
jgi:hypothetical protein